MSREPGAGSREPVTEALQAYADRGVFRGFRATPGRRGRTAYEFRWLTKSPVRAAFDSRTNTLRFPDLFPALDTGAAAAMAAVISSRTQRGAAAHKRIDGRRARLEGGLHKGAYALAVVVRGGNHDYAVSSALNVINEMFVTLQEHHPEYLIAQFGMSPE